MTENPFISAVEEVSYHMSKNKCPTPGCRGQGHAKGYEFASHDRLVHHLMGHNACLELCGGLYTPLPSDAVDLIDAATISQSKLSKVLLGWLLHVFAWS